jgi:hypothetical protein
MAIWQPVRGVLLFTVLDLSKQSHIIPFLGNHGFYQESNQPASLKQFLDNRPFWLAVSIMKYENIYALF